MLKKSFAFAFALAATVTCAAAALASEISHFTLDNGLDVVVIPDHRAPVVTHMVWYKVGSADETPGKSGLAHFLEHLMFKGTAKNPARTLFPDGRDDRWPGECVHLADYTGYFQRVPREQLKSMMEFEADRMTGLLLTNEAVRPELQRGAGRAEHARGQQPYRAASASRWRPRSTSTILMADP